MRSLYSGVSGLKVHQTKMDVIGNNISNVNTVGFKSSSVTFSDVLYQTTQNATGPNPETGRAGQNAMQIGLGVSVSSIAVSQTSGGAQRTDNPMDMMIEGEGFFIVNNGTSNYFTKAGSFTVDGAGNLCNAAGYRVMGWTVDPNDETRIMADSVKELQVMGAQYMYSEPQATTHVNFSGNIDSADEQLAVGRTTNFTFYDKLGQSYTAQLSVKQVVAEDNNFAVDNQYDITVVDVMDSNGDSIFVKAVEADGKITYETSTAVTGFSFGEGEYTIGSVNPEDGTVILTGTPVRMTFNAETGRFVSVGADAENTKSVKFGITAAEEENPFTEIDVDFSQLTMFANSGKTTIEGQKGSYAGLGRGCAVGSMSGVTVDNSGKIYGVYDNGDQRLLGQVVVATFPNLAGLEAVGNNLFMETQNSGAFDGIGEDITSSGGKFNVGVLEMSNVDLAAQFTEMITTQRGFQANSRIITTSDTLLEELINLKR